MLVRLTKSPRVGVTDTSFENKLLKKGSNACLIDKVTTERRF